MKWSRKSSHAIQSGEHFIARFVVMSRDQFWLWRGSDVAGAFDTADQAKAAANEKVQ